MNSKVVIMFVACLFFVSFISASVILEIQTLPDHEIFITEVDAYSSDDFPINRFQTFTGEGKIELEYAPEKDTFKIGLLLKDEGRMVLKYKIFDDLFHNEERIKLNFIPDEIGVEEVSLLAEEIVEEAVEEVVEEVNVSESNESEVSEPIIENELVDKEVKEIDSNESSEGIFGGILMSGNAVYQENKLAVNLLSYFLGAVLLVVPVYMLFKKRKGKKGSLIPEGVSESDDEEEALKKAEEDLKKARERIDALKGKKISAAREKLIADEKELMRLRKLGKD